MAVGTKPPVRTTPAKSAKSTTAVTRKKPASAKPAARTKVASAAVTATAKPAGRRTPVPAKATATVVRKTVARTPVAKKSVPVKVVHPPEPFVAKDNKKGKPAKVKVKKAKLVRDSFTMPDVEYALIATLKRRCLNVGLAAKKSEILRAAVANLAKLSDASLAAAVHRLEVIKTGRPSKNAK